VDAMNRVRAHLVIGGRVQGVWFRASTRDVAQKLGLSGWVRNLESGAVEAVFEGPRDRVEEAVAWCRQGPAGARVGRCDVTWGDPEGEGPFEVRYP
jgi:acylphosphatase